MFLLKRYSGFGMGAGLMALMLCVSLSVNAYGAAGDGGGGGEVQGEGQTFAEAFLYAEGEIVGTAVIWFLILLSFVNVGVMIWLYLQNRRKQMIPAETQEKISYLLSQKLYDQAIAHARSDSSYLGKVVYGGLIEAMNGYGAMERGVEEVSDMETTKQLRRIEVLNVMGNIAPMIGLLGTVYGMIRAFQKLVESGGKADTSQLAGGISTALVTTCWGLVVAIPALAGYALIRNNIDALSSEGLVVAEGMIKPFKPMGQQAGGLGGAGVGDVAGANGGGSGEVESGKPNPDEVV